MSVSCSGRKTKLDKKNLIPEKELVSVLTDIHIADGLLALPKINSWSSSLDSISAYYQVIEKHGYTKEIMDKTMSYYFLNNPKKLNKIYDQVLGILSEMESRVEKESSIENARISNLWKGKDFYSIPSLSGNDSAFFDMALPRSGTYALLFSATLFPDDQSINPRATVYSCSPDSIDTERGQDIKSICYIKDGRPHNYKVIIAVPGNRIRHLKGWFYDLNNPFNCTDKHVKIENISLIFSSLAV
jgi:hypothetical protein